MDLELLTVGTELLLGFTVDSNAAELARQLAEVGARVVRTSTVGDDQAAIEQALREALARSGFVIVTGGLGPTSDDRTKEAVAALYGAPLDLDHHYLGRLERRFAQLGRKPMPQSNRRQAEVPRGAVVLPNRLGTAPGLWVEDQRGATVLLPGVPHEMRTLMHEAVLPRIRERIERSAKPVGIVRSRTLRTTGVSESALADQLEPLEPQLGSVTLAYVPTLGGVDLRLTAWDLPAVQADERLQGAVGVIRPALGSHLYGEGEDDLAEVVLRLLRERGLHLAVAESCTGGLIGGRLTAVPGSSDVFLGGVICYADQSKVDTLDVPPEVLERDGAVSETVVDAMVDGALQRFAANAGVAVTGIAGPSGGTDEKPVGTVWIAARVGEARRTLRRYFPGGRAEIRQRTAQAALDTLRRLIKEGN